jgi:hypothetical protein
VAIVDAHTTRTNQIVSHLLRDSVDTRRRMGSWADEDRYVPRRYTGIRELAYEKGQDAGGWGRPVQIVNDDQGPRRLRATLLNRPLADGRREPLPHFSIRQLTACRWSEDGNVPRFRQIEVDGTIAVPRSRLEP